MILVTGATGTVGTHLVRELAAAGVPTRALVRSVEAVSPLRDIGVDPFVGSFDDDEALNRALVGVERVFLLPPAGVFSAPHVTRVSMIDARDVAAVAARALTGDGHEHKAYTLTGPESLSYTDVAAVYSGVLGRPVQWQPITLAEVYDAMVASGLPEELAAGFCEILRRCRAGGVTQRVSPAVAELLGRAPRTALPHDLLRVVLRARRHRATQRRAALVGRHRRRLPPCPRTRRARLQQRQR